MTQSEMVTMLRTYGCTINFKSDEDRDSCLEYLTSTTNLRWYPGVDVQGSGKAWGIRRDGSGCLVHLGFRGHYPDGAFGLPTYWWDEAEPDLAPVDMDGFLSLLGGGDV